PVRAQVALQSRLRAADEDAGPRCITLAREPLEAAMRAGRVAAELAYRLAGPVLALPPPRGRVADQLDYCTALARQLAQSLGRPTPHIDRAFVEALAQQGFPGNRLGVEHRLRRLLIESDGPARTLASGVRDEGGALPSMPVQGEPDDEGVLDLRALERGAIVRALERMQGNRTHASRALGISVRTLRNKIREYGLR